MELNFSLSNIKETATRFWKMADDVRVFAFHGEMGAGKTTFIHALCDAKGVKDAVTSPTFSIINEYSYIENDIAKKIFHLDLYRLKDEEEAIRAGMEDCLYSDAICLVEWPEKAAAILPDDTLHIYLKITDSASRKLRIDDKIS
jgi:tRNA threonylcarbamoyladenosine biosynthesis protein TsaE